MDGTSLASHFCNSFLAGEKFSPFKYLAFYLTFIARGINRQVVLADLCQYPVCLPEPGSTVRQLFDISCQMNGTFIEPVLTCDNFSTLYYFLQGSPLAVTICSQFTAMPLLQPQGLILKSFAVEQQSPRTLQLQLPLGRQRSTALELFVDYINQTLSREERAIGEKFGI
ncbi:LysR substrate-binding domain-containing protein [Serratia sp. 14-2641]|uniref:LysR substrate-binding domain-containing protein n=1 Tax=Serratia sp. 14-2641 TaxID=1841657 RepID=UPI0009F58680|nr:LysR substrate-binding domain-containing protein [Serratia sp. 14-2641]